MRQSVTTKPTIFESWNDELENRLDPLFYAGDLFEFLKKTKFEIVDLGNVIRFIKAGFAAGKQDQDESSDGVIQIRPTNIDEFGVLNFDKTIVLPKELSLPDIF